MATLKKEIESWLKEPYIESPSHMIVVCDTFSHEDFPVYVESKQECEEKIKEYEEGNFTKIMEVYNFKMPMPIQLAQRRAYNI